MNQKRQTLLHDIGIQLLNTPYSLLPRPSFDHLDVLRNCMGSTPRILNHIDGVYDDCTILNTPTINTVVALASDNVATPGEHVSPNIADVAHVLDISYRTFVRVNSPQSALATDIFWYLFGHRMQLLPLFGPPVVIHRIRTGPLHEDLGMLPPSTSPAWHCLSPGISRLEFHFLAIGHLIARLRALPAPLSFEGKFVSPRVRSRSGADR